MNRGRILVVEDEPALLFLLGKSLKRRGFEVTLAASAEEAAPMVNTSGGGFALYLIDLTLPGKSGLELAAQILERSPSAPILLISGYPHAAESMNIPAGSRVAFLLKPFPASELDTALNEMLPAG